MGIVKSQDLRAGTQDPETWGPENWDPRFWDTGPWDPKTWLPGTLELAPWALGLATLGHGNLTPGTLLMGPWDQQLTPTADCINFISRPNFLEQMKGHGMCVENVGARIQK